MKRNTVRLAAIALAAGISVSELAAIGTLADAIFAADEAVAVLPRVVVTPGDAGVNLSASEPAASVRRTAPVPPR
jgi:hypothetical protein